VASRFLGQERKKLLEIKDSIADITLQRVLTQALGVSPNDFARLTGRATEVRRTSDWRTVT
jgi:hypothetical protein